MPDPTTFESQNADKRPAARANDHDDDDFEHVHHHEPACKVRSKSLDQYKASLSRVHSAKSKKSKSVNPSKLVRTDPNAGSIESFLLPYQQSTPTVNQMTAAASKTKKRQRSIAAPRVTSGSSSEKRSSGGKSLLSLVSGSPEDKGEEDAEEEEEAEFEAGENVVEGQLLSSVRDIRAEFEGNVSQRLKHLFQNHVFVGVVDDTYALMQVQTGLYMIDYVQLARELFYQQTFRMFGLMRHSVEEPKLSEPFSWVSISLTRRPRTAIDDGKTRVLLCRWPKCLTNTFALA